MKTIKIQSDRKLDKQSLVVGYLNENNAETIKFEIPEEYENYSRVACFKVGDVTFQKLFDDLTSNYLTLTSDVTKYSELDMSIQFVDNDNEVVARTSILHLIIENSIISTGDVQADDDKVVILNELIDNVSNLNVESTKTDDGVEVTFTSKTGEQTVRKLTNGVNGTDGKDGQNGTDGKNATINGVNALTITAGDNIELNQEDDTLSIKAIIPDNVAPIILGATEILELHNLTPRMSDNQVFCESIFEKYGDGLFYVNSNFYLSNSTEDITDTNDSIDVGSTILVSNKGRSILVFSNNWYYNVKYYKCVNTYADSNSRYNVTTLTTEKLYDLIDNASDLLTIDNATEYTPTSDYQPTTKKYVDEKVIAERSIYYTEIFASNWYEKETLQEILDLAYKGGYDDVFIKTNDGTRFITCSGASLQDLNSSIKTTILFANLKYITGSTTAPNTIFYGYAYANQVTIDDNGDVAINSTTGLYQNSVKVMKDMTLIDGYDKSKTQVLKNVSGALQWVTE